jgi:hypothetical protein
LGCIWRKKVPSGKPNTPIVVSIEAETWKNRKKKKKKKKPDAGGQKTAQVSYPRYKARTMSGPEEVSMT